MGNQRIVTAIRPRAAEHGVDDVLFVRTIEAPCVMIALQV